MMQAIVHRGPDDHGQYESEFKLNSPYEPFPGIALGFRRLSIIDLEAGRQPMSNEDGTVWVIFNGEIYNYETLRRRLEGNGHRFQTNSDTETIVHLYEDHGEDFPKYLNGMFSIAVWDQTRRKLILARDRVGQKPLYFHREQSRVVFASELKSILQVPGVTRELDYGSVDEYLTYQYVPYPNTIFKGIAKLPPGHVATFQDGKFNQHPYWSPEFQSQENIAPEKAREQLAELLESSVKMRMRSDVPLGSFLSGGVDSSLIVALMQKNSTQQIKTFSIGFPVKSYDETAFAQQAAKFIGTDHHEFQVTPNAVEILPKLVWHYDEPFADSSAIPTWYVSKLTREQVTVSLSGDGGDELFAGYPRYKALSIGQFVDRLGPIRSILASKLLQKLPGSAKQKGFIRRLKRFGAALNKSHLERYLDWICIFNEDRRADLYTDDFFSQLPNSDPINFLKVANLNVNKRDLISAISLTDLQTYLTCDLMTKVDIASMAHSLEVRQPFLDHRVIEFAAKLPLKYKFRRGVGKLILRDTFQELLPKEIWSRKKMGFGVPLDHWFRSELKEMSHDILLDQRTIDRNLFRREAIETLLDEHSKEVFDHAYRLWSLLFFELWMREWVD